MLCVFKVDSERKIFCETFHDNFYLLSEFLPEICCNKFNTKGYFLRMYRVDHLQVYIEPSVISNMEILMSCYSATKLREKYDVDFSKKKDK